MNDTSTSHQPFFIVGAQRSGTTLLRLILNAHSDVAIPEEARFLTPLLTKRYMLQSISGKDLERAIKYLRANEQFRLWNYDKQDFFNYLEPKESIELSALISKMFQSYAESEGKHYWGDKSLFFDVIEQLDCLFPHSLFINIVRDGRDVFSSWRKMDNSKGHSAVIALDWKYKMSKIDDSLKYLPSNRKITIRYEDLLSSPEEIIKNICQFIGVSFEENMLNFYKSSHNYIGDHHSKLIFNAIDNSNTEKWKTMLSNSEIRHYEILNGEILRKYGYEVSDQNIQLTELFSIFFDLLVGLPLRVWQVIQARWFYSRALQRGTATSISVGEMPKGQSSSKSQQ